MFHYIGQCFGGFSQSLMGGMVFNIFQIDTVARGHEMKKLNTLIYTLKAGYLWVTLNMACMSFTILYFGLSGPSSGIVPGSQGVIGILVASTLLGAILYVIVMMPLNWLRKKNREKLKPNLSSEEDVSIWWRRIVILGFVSTIILFGYHFIDMTLIQETITAIRTLRKQVNLAPKVEIEIFIKVASNKQVELLKSYENYFQKLAKVTSMKADVNVDKPASSIAAVVQNMEIYLPLEGLIDLDAERDKFTKQLVKLERELKIISGKLNNAKFIANAPDDIVQKEKEKFSEIETKVNKTKELLAGLK